MKVLERGRNGGDGAGGDSGGSGSRSVSVSEASTPLVSPDGVGKGMMVGGFDWERRRGSRVSSRQ